MIFLGKITEIGKINSGTSAKGVEWASLDIEVTESNPHNALYPQIGLFSFFKNGEYVKFAKDFNDFYKIGDEVSVDFNLKCIKYEKGGEQRKFYKTECWKLEKASETVNGVPVIDQPNSDDVDPLPF